jgi:GNAT superfamily N-acetyltransferase
VAFFIEEVTVMKIKSVSLQSAAEDEFAGLLEIQKEAFARYTDHLSPAQIPPLNETLEDMRKDMTCKSIIAAYVDGSLAGSIRYYMKGGVCIIERLSVKPGLQGAGIGRSLIEAVEKMVRGKAHKLYLETGLLENNLLLFYTKLGYSGEAVLRNHYGGFDWIVFSRFIEREQRTDVAEVDA